MIDDCSWDGADGYLDNEVYPITADRYDPTYVKGYIDIESKEDSSPKESVDRYKILLRN